MSQQPDTYTVNEILCFDANNSDRVFVDYPDYKRLQAELSAIRRENEELKRAVKQNDETAQHYLAGRTEARQEAQQLRAALASARSKITAAETDADEVLDFDECTAMLLPMDAYHGLVEIGEQIDAMLSGQPDGPGEEDGPWAEGWKERVGQSVEDPRDKVLKLEILECPVDECEACPERGDCTTEETLREREAETLAAIDQLREGE